MCVGKCSRIVGPCLLVLGTLSMAASLLLLFPGGASQYLLEGHLGRHARAVPGLWGGTVVLLAATHITALGWRCSGCSGCGTRHNVSGAGTQGWGWVAGMRLCPTSAMALLGDTAEMLLSMAPGWMVVGIL